MRQNYFSDIKGAFNRADVVKRFIYLNVAIFLILKLIGLCFFLIDYYPLGFDPASWFGFPSNISRFLYKPWTVITYMFFHQEFFHILSNMLFFYFAGNLFVEYLGTRRLIVTYFIGGIIGALFFMICFLAFPVFNKFYLHSITIGASAAVFAVFIGIATYVPNYMVNLFLLGNVRLKIIAIVVVILDLLSITKGNPGGHLSHLGGAMFGYFFATQLKKGRDISVYFSSFFMTLKSVISFNRKGKLKVSYSKYPKDNKKSKQQQIDAILDKIAKSGYESLSKQEKDDLFNLSK